MTPSRRQFLRQTSAIAALPAAPWRPAGSPPADAAPWYKSAYRRAVIDMHIPDWDEAFLAKFDPAAYADQLVKSRSQSIVCYAMSHVGLFNYPTKVGRPHARFAERDVLREMVDACHARDIAVVLYVSLIFDRASADAHPEWRMRTWDGKVQGEGGRHGVLCVNSPYREYVRAFVSELAGRYDVEGLRCDMTFWPWLCFCEHCKRRHADEAGGEIPTTIDWIDPRWVAFQRCRERWLVEFAAIATDAAKAARPSITVEHQASTYPLNWMFGVTSELAARNDFLQGDFYGDRFQGSFVRKLLEDLTPNRPFGYETSVSVELKDHTARKPEALLEAKAAAAIADHAAFVFIDAIDPSGTVNPLAHERMGRVFDRLMPFYSELGGTRVRDVAVYHSQVSKFDPGAGPRPAASPDTSDTHTAASQRAGATLVRRHVPIGVITRPGLEEKLRGVKLLVLSNVHAMDDEESRIIREWVEAGGSLYASGGVGLFDPAGGLRDNFPLADVLGVTLDGKPGWNGRPHYIAPTPTGAGFFPEHNAEYPAFSTGFGLKVKARDGAEVLATRTLPWPAPDGSRFASIHSDPPWVATEEPELVRNRFGRGRAVYAATPIETLDGLEATFGLLVDDLAPSRSMEVDAPGCVEATLFHQPDRSRHVVALASFQAELPNLPIDGIVVRLRPSEPIRRVVALPGGRPIATRREADALEFDAPRLETLALFAAEY